MSEANPDLIERTATAGPAVFKPKGAAYRPRIPIALAALALLLTLGLAFVASRHKASQDAILDEQQALLELRAALSWVERQVLLSRNDESTLLLKGGSDPIEGFEQCMLEVDQAWKELEANLHAVTVAEELRVVRETIDRYRSAVSTSIRILQRLGRAGTPGLLDELSRAEASLDELFRRFGVQDLNLRFANLRLRQRDFGNSLNIEHAEALLRDTEALAATVEKRPGSTSRSALLQVIDDYRTDVASGMSGVLELELATSQSSLRFERVSPGIRGIEVRIDEALQATAQRLQARRQASLTQTVVMIAAVFLVFLLLMVLETRRAGAWLALESRLQQAQKLESLGVLTGGIAHDFNNLLTGVLGNAQLASAQVAAPSALRGHIAAIETAATRAAELVKQMLAYAGQGRFVFETCDLGDLVEEMTRLLESAISKKVRLTLSRVSARTPVEADATQLRQVIMNLITNASDALGDQEGTIRIQTLLVDIEDEDSLPDDVSHRLEPGRFVSVEIADDGCGMDEETRRRIFEPFFTTKTKGRGLGMAAVLGIIRAHRGAITVDSQPGRGSTFRILLPISTRTVKASPSPSREESRRGHGTVMVVDDDDLVRVVAQGCLAQLGFDVLVAEDGLSAVHLFSQHADEVEVVLLDLSMPGLDGEETLRELRRIRPYVKAVLCSGHPEEKVLARVRGLAGFLEKPYGPERLAEAVFDALDALDAPEGSAPAPSASRRWMTSPTE